MGARLQFLEPYRVGRLTAGKTAKIDFVLVIAEMGHRSSWRTLTRECDR